MQKEIKRILEISYKYQLSHIGSCITALPIIDGIYKTKKSDEKFVLSQGHAGLALYVVLEKYLGLDAEEIWLHHGTHPDRCEKCKLDCSTGSLGQGLPIAVGMALADRSRNVYCLISDGECAEGSIWEALRIAKEQKLVNLIIFANLNGWGAYKSIDVRNLGQELFKWRIQIDGNPNLAGTMGIWYQKNDFPFLQGLEGHYHVLTKEEYETYIC